MSPAQLRKAKQAELLSKQLAYTLGRAKLKTLTKSNIVRPIGAVQCLTI